MIINIKRIQTSVKQELRQNPIEFVKTSIADLNLEYFVLHNVLYSIEWETLVYVITMTSPIRVLRV